VFSQNHQANRKKIMKTTKLFVTGILVAVSLALTCITSHAQYVTNFMTYNFNTDQVDGIWTNWFGTDFVSVQWDTNTPTPSYNPTVGSMLLTVDYAQNQYVLMDGYTPSYSPLPIQGQVAFTNLQFDVKYYSTAPGLIRTNPPAGNGTPGVPDFGYARVGSRTAANDQDWYYYFAVPATNSLGQPNTNWVHISADLSEVLNDLASSGLLINTMFAQDDADFGNNVLSGTQFIWFDNIQYSGWVSPLPPTISWSASAVLLNLASVPGSTNRLWATTNLSPPMTQWQVLATNVATNGFFQFMDTNTSGYPAKFYRLSTP
jgi:hypothetical protein